MLHYKVISLQGQSPVSSQLPALHQKQQHSPSQPLPSASQPHPTALPLTLPSATPHPARRRNRTQNQSSRSPHPPALTQASQTPDLPTLPLSLACLQYKRTGRWEAHIWEAAADSGVGKARQLHLGFFATAEQAAK